MGDCSVSQKSSSSPGNSCSSQETNGHVWYVCSHARPTYCNVCREKLSGMAWHGLSCEVCRIKAHKRCAPKIVDACKWTDENSVPEELRAFDSAGVQQMPHQWVEGNLPIGCRCCVCDKTCGSVLKLQDWRCLWCGIYTHDQCKTLSPPVCSLGPARLSIIPPIAFHSVSKEGEAEMRWHCIGGDYGGGSPLLVLVNSKSGENQGMRILAKFKRWLNPAQVVDIISMGPQTGLKFFQKFDSFRVLVCGGDGTVGWVLSAIDQLALLSKCQLGILPLGTGNDLARVLGWGRAFDDDSQLPHVIEKFERAHTRMLDRWSVLTCDFGMSQNYAKEHNIVSLQKQENIISDLLLDISSSSDDPSVFCSLRTLCETIRKFIGLVKETVEESQVTKESNPTLRSECDDIFISKFDSPLLKLENMMRTLEAESAVLHEQDGSTECSDAAFSNSSSSAVLLKERVRAQRDLIMSRENSLRKAVHQLAQNTGNFIEELNERKKASTIAKRERFRKKRSRTTPGITGKSGSTTWFGEDSMGSLRSHSPFTVVPESGEFFAGDAGLPATTPKSHLDSKITPSPSSQPVISEPNFDDRVFASPAFPSISDVQPSTPSVTPSALDPPKMSEEEPSKWLEADFPAEGFEERSASKSKTPSSDFSHPSSDSPGTEHPFNHITCPLKQTSEADLLFVSSESKLRKKRACADLKSRSDGSIYLNNDNEKSAQSICNGLPDDFSRHTYSPAVPSSPRMVFTERKVMNNYFGIGLDAKIALEFHNKREELPEKARSRSKLFMWYGMLGGKELLHRTYRNLDQKIRLECDDQPVQLPSLQGIVILNIPSYSGGADFWGSTREGSECAFTAQSFDDRVLEVIALFGVIHVATSRVPRLLPLQNHRIAQCRQVKVVICGDEAIPVQVDGEPWLQPPGVIHIVHKNRAQVLVHNPAFEATLKSWQEQNRTAPTTPTALVHTHFLSVDSPSLFVEAAARLTDLLDTTLPDACPLLLDGSLLQVISDANAAITVALERNAVEVNDPCITDLVHRVRILVDTLHERLPLDGSIEDNTEDINEWRSKLTEALCSTAADLEKMERTLFELETASPKEKVAESVISESDVGEVSLTTETFRIRPLPRAKSRFAQWLRKKWGRRRRRAASADAVLTWSVDEVCTWMGSVGFDAYSKAFRAHEIAGRELLRLHAPDLRELGIAESVRITQFQTAISNLRKRLDGAGDARITSSRSKWKTNADSNDASVSSL